MILAFTQQINNKPTYFVERIWEGLLRNNFDTDKEYDAFLNEHKIKFGSYWDWFPDEHERMTNPKIHSIREDSKERWKAGTMIDFFINCRQPNMFRFAPRVPVVSVQTIEIEKLCDSGVWYQDFIVLVDDIYQNKKDIKAIAQNDGFDSVEEFFLYFNTDFKGKLIHWTDLRY